MTTKRKLEPYLATPALPSLWVITCRMPDGTIIRQPEQYTLVDAARICAGLNEEYGADIPHWLKLVEQEAIDNQG